MNACHTVITTMVELVRHSLVNNTVNLVNIWHMIVATMVEIMRHPPVNYYVPL
jgi:hypothetical protein